MGGWLKTFSDEAGFTLQGTKCWGTFEGYWFGMALAEGRRGLLNVYTAVKYPEGADKNAINSVFSQLKANKRIATYDIHEESYHFTVMPSFTGIKPADIKAMLHELTMAFKQQNAQPSCYNCNSTALSSFADLNGVPICLCDGCHTNIEQTIQQCEQDHAYLPNNYLRGALGAVIGALLGAVIWVAIGLFGYIAAIAGAAITFFAVKGYTMLKGKLNIPGVVMLCFICLCTFALAQFATWDALLIKDIIAKGYEVDYAEVFKATFQIPFFDSESTSAFIKDSLLGLLFMAAGSWSTIKSVSRQASKPAGSITRLPV